MVKSFSKSISFTTCSSISPFISTFFLMDFRLEQKEGATFMYVLPTSKNEALIEYTLFSKDLLEKEVYKQELTKYIADFLGIEDYEITHTEFGVIPMSLAKFDRNPNAQSRILNIGTAGGFTKSSSGYTFQFIQKNSEILIKKLTLTNCLIIIR